MKWNKIRLKTTVEAEDIIISELADIGIEGAQIEDKVPLTPLEKELLFVDILPESDADDREAYLSFYLDESTDMDEMLCKVQSALDRISEFIDIGEGTLEVSKTDDIDWINNWKEYFTSFSINDILIVPSWEEVEDAKDKVVIQIDPGTAFGTGMHETTQLCIQQLKKHMITGDRVLDVGCGSGILGMVALKYGASYSVGIDLDPYAIEATCENMEVNGINENQYQVMIGNIIDDMNIQEAVGYKEYDVALANILPDVLVPLTPVVANCLKPGGIYITSGILKEKVDLVKEVIEKVGMKVIEVTSKNEWSAVTARKGK